MTLTAPTVKSAPPSMREADQSARTLAARRDDKQRKDIQALRAIAVLFVVVYHFFPGFLPGGFVGVDIFFVISGFLITSHLLERPPRSARDLAEFWGRRIRRLLPATFVVLAVTIVGVLVWAPQTVWTNWLAQIAASASYVENWFLAGQAVNYLAADNAASPVQHFWSLSVEEQFYLLWPVLVMAGLFLASASRRRQRRRIITAVLGTIVLASFVVSVWLTVVNPAGAYFITWTRIWELGIGGLAACVFRWLQKRLKGRDGVRLLLAYAGLAMIAWSGVTYTGSMPFPSYTAALPVVGTALVLLAAVRRGLFSPLRAMSWQPVQLLGDVSYGLYLWHWPMLVLLPYAIGHGLHRSDKLVAIAVAIALAWLSKVYVEDVFRGRKPLGVPLRRSFVFAIVGMLAFGITAAGIIGWQAQQATAAQAAVTRALNDPSSCFGARALAHPSTCSPHGEKLLTSPTFAAADQPAPYKDNCWILGDFSEQKTCHYGSDSPDAVKVALVGNSHAGHWLPALQQIAQKENWSITTYLISECYTVDAVVTYETPARTANCVAWNKKTIAAIAHQKYDLVVFSNRTAGRMPGMNLAQTQVAAQKDYRSVLEKWSAAGRKVLVLHDTPYALDLPDVPDCVAAHLDDLSACDGTTARKQVDPAANAAAQLHDPNVSMLDLSDRICSASTCYSVIGGTIVYFDRGHLSATFARSLTPDIQAAADRLLRR
ncbi:MAG TPA: acyltransferase family protein [Microbacterium sp.]|nr:acyltransferase family protein [Microbacterium sp.]